MHSDMRIVLAFTVPAVAALFGLLWVLNNRRRPKGGKSDPAVKDAKLSSKSEGISTVSEPVASPFLNKDTTCKAFKESPQESSEIVSHDAACYEGGKNSCLSTMNLQHVHNIPFDGQDVLSLRNVTVTSTNSIVKLVNSGTCLPLQSEELSETGCSSKTEVKLNESHKLSDRKYVEVPSFSIGSSPSIFEDGTNHLKQNIPTIAVEKTKDGDAESSALLTQKTSMESWDVAQLIPSLTVLTPSSVTDLMITNEVDVSKVDKDYPGDIATDSEISLAHQQMEATSGVMCFGPLGLGEEKKEDAGEVDTVVQSFPTSPYACNVESDFSENACSVGCVAPSSSETPEQSIDASLDSTVSCDANKNTETVEINQEKLGASLLLTCKKCDTLLGIQDKRTSISGTFADLSPGCTSFHSEDDVGKSDCSMGLCQTGVKEMLVTTDSSDPPVSSFSFVLGSTALSHDVKNTQADITNSPQDQTTIEDSDCSGTCNDFTCTSTYNTVVSEDNVASTDTSTGHISVTVATESPATESIGNYFSIGGNSYKRQLKDTDTMAKANLSLYNEDVAVADHLLLSQKHFVSNKSLSPLENKERGEIVSATPQENITAQRTRCSECQQDLLSTCTVDSLVSKESASATENNLGAGSRSDDLTLLEAKLLPSDPFHFTDNSSFTCVENISKNDDQVMSETQESSSSKEAPVAMLNDIFKTQLHTSITYVAEGSDSVCTTELPLDDELCLHRRDSASERPMLSVFKEASSVPAKTVSSHISLDPGGVNSRENNLDAFNQLSSLPYEKPYSDDLLNIHQDRLFMDGESCSSSRETLQLTIGDEQPATIMEPHLQPFATNKQNEHCISFVSSNLKASIMDQKYKKGTFVAEHVFQQSFENTVGRSKSEEVACEACETALGQTVTDTYKQVVTETKLEPTVTDSPEQVVTDVCETNLEKTVLETSKQLVADICETELKQTVTDVAEQVDAYVCKTELEQTVADTGEQAVCDSYEGGLEQTVTGEQEVTDAYVAELEQAVRDTQRQIVTNVCETKLKQTITDTPEQVVTAAAICEPDIKQTVTERAEQANANVGEIQLEPAVIDMSGQVVTDVYETESEQIETDAPELVIDVCRNKLEENVLDIAAACETKLQQTATDTDEQTVSVVCETLLEQTVIDTHEHAIICETEFVQTETDTCEQTVSDAHEAWLEQTGTGEQVVADVCETDLKETVSDTSEQTVISVCEADLEQTVRGEQVVTDVCETKLEQSVTNTCEQVDICEIKFVSDTFEQAVPSICKADLGQTVTDMPEQLVTNTSDNQEKQEPTDICESNLEQTAMNKMDEVIVSDCESKLEQSVVDKQDEQAAVDLCKSGFKQSVTYNQDEQVVMGVSELETPLTDKQNDQGVFSVHESNVLQSGTEKLDEQTGVLIAVSKKSILLGEDEQTTKVCEIKRSVTDIADEQTVLKFDTIQLALNNHEQDNDLFTNKRCRKAVMNSSEHGFQQSLTDTQDKQVVFAVSESAGQHNITNEKDEHTALTIDVSFKFHEPAEYCAVSTSPDKTNGRINPLADGNSTSSLVLQESKQKTVTETVSEHNSVVDEPASLQSLLTNSSWLSNDHSHPDTDDSQDQGNSWIVVESEIKMDVEADLFVKTRSKDSPLCGLSQHKMMNNHRKSQKKKATGARSPKPSDPHTEYNVTGGTSSPVGKGKKSKSSTKPDKILKNSSESFKTNMYSTSSSPESDLKDRGPKAFVMPENSLQPRSGFDRNNQHLEKGASGNESQSPKDGMQTEFSAQLCNGNKQTDHCFQEAQEELSEQEWIGLQISNGSEHMELNATNMASSSSLVAASLVTVEFNFPTDLCGRLIGRNGRNVQHIKEQSGASVIITSNPVSPDFQLCRVQGLHSCVHEALMMIKKKFPQVDVQPILAPNLNPLIMPDMIKLNLPDGVSVKLVVSNIVNAGHIFVQLPNHPTFASLDRLCHCMNSCYSKNQGVPPLPRPVETGVICAAESGGCWFRVEIIGVYPETDECDIGYVDYGGYDRVALSSLRQIRSDFMTLPFQAIECYMANITPLQDEEYFSENASSVLHELTADKLLDGQVITREGSIPYIHLYQISTRGALLVNREMVNREVVRWIEIF